MKTMRVLVLVLLAVSLLLAACGPAPTPTPVPTPVPPTKPPAPAATPVPPTAAPAATATAVPPTATAAKPRLKCATPIKIGLITDKSGALASYGAMTERAFLLGWEYLAGAPGKDNVFKVDDCEIQITVADDKGVVATTATAEIGRAHV